MLGNSRVFGRAFVTVFIMYTFMYTSEIYDESHWIYIEGLNGSYTAKIVAVTSPITRMPSTAPPPIVSTSLVTNPVLDNVTNSEPSPSWNTWVSRGTAISERSTRANPSGVSMYSCRRVRYDHAIQNDRGVL